jgi:hypothetical protein
MNTVIVGRMCIRVIVDSESSILAIQKNVADELAFSAVCVPSLV